MSRARPSVEGDVHQAPARLSPGPNALPVLDSLIFYSIISSINDPQAPGVIRNRLLGRCFIATVNFMRVIKRGKGVCCQP